MAKKWRKDLQIRRAKAKAASDRQALVRMDSLTLAQDLMRGALAPLNDESRAPDIRLQAQARRGMLPIPGLKWSPEDKREVAADQAAGIATTQQLLAHWDHALVARLLERAVVVGAEYRLMPDGRVVLEPRVTSGPADVMAALELAQARHLLRLVDGTRDPFKRRVKRCGNPTCEKWFFDAERGTRKWCCIPCGNAHRQLKRSKQYQKRLKAGEYARRRCPCVRQGCEG
jgi:hypothetical protein